MAKWFLSEHEVYVNGEVDDHRGRKVRHGDVINIPKAYVIEFSAKII